MTDPISIIAVDDSPDSLALIHSLLAHDGYDIRLADSGALALESARSAPPDLVLLDLRMPEMDGLEVLRRLKSDEATQHVPVILVSGQSDTRDWVAGLQLGAADYVRKPYQAEELRSRVRTQLALRAAREELARQADALRRVASQLDEERAVRQRAEAELHALDVFYREQFNRHPTVTLLIDPETRVIVEANAAALRYYGYSRDDLLGRFVTDINGLSAEEAAARTAAVLREGGLRFDMEHRLADGSRRTVSVASSPVHFGGRVVLQSFVEDVTEHRRAEKALRESEERYRLLVEMSPDAVIAHIGGRLVFVNEACVRMMGATDASQMLGRSIREFIHPDQWAASAERTRRVLEAGERAAPRETVFIRLDGSPIDVESTGTLIMLDGQPAALATFRDITERKAQERALRASEARYRLLSEEVKDVVWILDAETERFDYVSPSVVRLRGYTPEEVQAQTLTHALTEEAAAFVRDIMARRVVALRSGEQPGDTYYTEEVEQPCKDGTTVWTEVITSFYFDPDSGRPKVRGVTRDISERRRAEAERARLGAHLQQAQKMESVGRLAGGIAHDFNNMLSVILGNLELALHEVNTSSQLYADLIEIQKAARHSADITRQLLAYARRQTVTPAVLDLNASVGKSLSLLRPLLGEEIQVAWRPAPSLWHVTIDPSQMDQVVTNLCLNARDAIAGVGKLTLATENVTLDEAFCAEHDDALAGEFVRLTVTDNGSGISADVMANIFEPFFTTKDVGEGTGLGLATVYGALKQNGGFVTVSSEVGRGSTFAVYLPRHVADGDAAREPRGPSPSPRGQGTILLVEDEPGILRLATRSLTSLGYTVLSARNPDEALRLARDHVGEIRLLLTDVVMPAMNGRQLADALRVHQPDLACLFMSGYSGAVLSEHGVGPDAHFISKPFSLRDLAAKVHEMLEEAGAGAS